jgi:hypothetical protein
MRTQSLLRIGWCVAALACARAEADWVNLTGTMTAPNAAESTVFGDHGEVEPGSMSIT